MELRQILYFNAVCREKSISKAAQSLFVTQQCISKQISLLEKELGTPLLIRSKNGASPTAEGIWLEEHAAMILQIEQDISSHFLELTQPHGKTIRIGIFNALSLFYDESFFQEFRKSHSDDTIQVFYMWNEQIEESLAKGEIDLGLSILPKKNASLHAEKLFTESFCCIVKRTHRLANRKVLHLDDFLHEKIAMSDENHSSYHSFMEECEKRGITPDIYKAPNLLSIYSYVLNHDNAVGFSLSSFAKQFQIEQIRCIPHEDPTAFWEICALMRQQDQNHYKKMMQDFVVPEMRGTGLR